MPMSSTPDNIPRRGGRGLRPWLILPKFIAVGLLLGGITTNLVILILYTDEKVTYMNCPATVELMRWIFRLMVIPGSSLAILAGLCLAATNHWAVMTRQRWLQLKIMIVVTAIPILHFWLRHQLNTLHHGNTGVETDLSIGYLHTVLIIAAGIILLLIWLGRIKPKLGQNWAKTYSRLKQGANH